jgi:beta-phosphoglucomutase family hydrolase
VVWDRFDAVLFDLDGVLTPTVEVHMRAWRELFTAYFTEQRVEPGYTDADYFAEIDGKPRYDGVRATLASRDLHLSEGDPADPPSAATVCGLGNTKQEIFDRLLDEGSVAPYPGSIALLDHLAGRGIALGVVSSSRNVRAVLAAARLAGRFGVVVDGNTAAAEGLAGKPSAATFAHAAQALGVAPERAVVIEDALSGVQAGRAGGFGLVVGVDRGAGAVQLRAAGADLVVHDLAELVEGRP